MLIPHGKYLLLPGAALPAGVVMPRSPARAVLPLSLPTPPRSEYAHEGLVQPVMALPSTPPPINFRFIDITQQAQQGSGGGGSEAVNAFLQPPAQGPPIIFVSAPYPQAQYVPGSTGVQGSQEQTQGQSQNQQLLELLTVYS